MKLYGYGEDALTLWTLNITIYYKNEPLAKT